MSVLVKGMEMPINCFRCDIRRSCDLAWYLDPDNRPDNCPLVEVPVPHGRLIDGDHLIRDEIKPFLYQLKNGDIAIPMIDIKHAQTVIEAEGEG